MDDLGEKLRLLRVGCKMTQADLAHELSISPSRVSSFENSRTEPPLQTLRGIAAYFHVTTDYLLGLTDCNMVSLDGLSKKDIAFIIKLVQNFKKRPQT